MKNRDVYRCPSAKVDQSAAFIYGEQDWVIYLMVNEGNWGDASGIGPCEGYLNYPRGWGAMSPTPSSSSGLLFLTPVMEREREAIRRSSATSEWASRTSTT